MFRVPLSRKTPEINAKMMILVDSFLKLLSAWEHPYCSMECPRHHNEYPISHNPSASSRREQFVRSIFISFEMDKDILRFGFVIIVSETCPIDILFRLSTPPQEAPDSFHPTHENVEFQRKTRRPRQRIEM